MAVFAKAIGAEREREVALACEGRRTRGAEQLLVQRSLKRKAKNGDEEARLGWGDFEGLNRWTGRGLLGEVKSETVTYLMGPTSTSISEIHVGLHMKEKVFGRYFFEVGYLFILQDANNIFLCCFLLGFFVFRIVKYRIS